MAKSTIKPTANAFDKVLQTAIRLFTQQGYFNTSVPDIVRVSGVSTGSIYHHFGDKEGIARVIFDSLVERMEAEFSDIERQYDTAEAQCQAVTKRLFQITEEEPEVMTYMLFVKHKEFMPESAPVCSSRPFTQMRRMVSNGMEAGEIRSMDEMVAASSVFGGVLRMMSLKLDGVLQHPLEEYLDEVWHCAWKSVSL